MSYCVNCGVQLDPAAKKCPLCGTPAWRPDPAAPDYFPTKPAQVQPASIGREDAGRDQQRIAGKEREEHQARFHEHYQEQRRVHPHRAQRDDPSGDGAARVA